MSKVYGYARISRKEQSIERQIRNIMNEYPDAIIKAEAFTGTKLEGRKELDKILKALKPGDTLVFDSVSRMSRNAKEGTELYWQLYNKGIILVFLKEGYINSETFRQAVSQTIPMTGTDVDCILEGVNKFMKRLAEKQIEIAFEQAQKEVDDNHQRTKEGIETARLEGKQIGQKAGAKLTVKKAIAAKEVIRKHSRDFEGTLSDIECIKLAGISRNSFYKYKKELSEHK